MNSDHYQQLELPSSVARTAKDKATPFTMVDNRVVHLDYKALGLKRGDKEIHIVLLSLPDNWDFAHIAHWLAKKFGFSKRTSFRIIGRLLDAGLMSRTEDEITGQWGYQVYEVPCENRPTGKAARERLTVTTRKARHSGFQYGPKMPRKHHGLLTVEDAGPAFSCTGRGVTKLSHRQTTKGNVLRSSEHSSTPLAPKGAPEFQDDLRVCCNDGSREPKPRRAKRQKGRSSPGKPHNARSKVPKQKFTRLSREQVNLSFPTATADTAAFMRNLAVELPKALADLQTLPPARTQECLDRLMVNPLVAVAQEVYGFSSWSCGKLRSFLGALGHDLPIEDLLLCWAGVNGRWSYDLAEKMRWRLTSGWDPTAPNIHRCDMLPDRVERVYEWQEAMDSCREAMSDQCTSAVVELLAGVNLNDPASIEEHPFIWTAVLACPADVLTPEEVIDEETVELARRTLVPVSREELEEWVETRCGAVPMRWHGAFCTGDIEVLVGRGISAALDEDIPTGLYRFSSLKCRGYKLFENARFAKVPCFD